MYSPVKIHKLSATQKRKLKKGDKVIIKKGNDEEINLSVEQAKKFERKSKVGAGLTIQLDPYQQDQMSGKGMQSSNMCCTNCGIELEGTGIKDFVGAVKKAKIGKKLIKFAKDTKLAKRVGNALIDRAVATIAGSGAETKTKRRGRPKKSDTGGAMMPAGGGGALKPAGSY
jgi:hypothetical protein